MKTTVEISDPLLRDARRVAEREGVTLRTLIERGLTRVVGDAKRTPAFKLKPVVFTGNGLQPEFRNASWDAIRDEVYRGRGS